MNSEGLDTGVPGSVLIVTLTGSGVLSLNSEGLDNGVTGSVLSVNCGVAVVGLNNGVIWRWGVGVGLPNPNFGLTKVDEGTEPEKAAVPVVGEAKPPANDDDL